MTIKERSVKGVKLSSYEIQENDIILRARRTSYGLFMFGFNFSVFLIMSSCGLLKHVLQFHFIYSAVECIFYTTF